MNDFNFEMVCITWSVNIFQMTSAYRYKSFMRGEKKAKCTEFNFDTLKQMFIHAVSDFTLQLLFTKLLLFEFRRSIKAIHDYLKRLLKHSSIFYLCILREARFSSYLSTKTIYGNRLNTESDNRESSSIQLK